MSVELPVEAGTYQAVVGQDRALAALRAAVGRPVHAYLFLGPPGTGKEEAALGFAAALLCVSGGDGSCDDCRRVLAGIHPDVVTVEREGASISIDMAREITRLAARSPVEGARKVLLLRDLHLVSDAGPALLKTIEEPPPSTVFVILADFLPPELVTIASRCVRVDFGPLSDEQIRDALVADGVPLERAAALSGAARGRLDRARLLATDPEVEARQAAWRAIPGRIDGTGATVAKLASELVALLERSVEPLKARQEAEVAALEERNARVAAVNGKTSGRGRGAKSGSGAKELEERHRREQRRQRVDELRSGLADLAGAYRDRLVAGGPGAAGAARAVELINGLAADLAFNPGELLALQALLVRLGQLT